MIAIDWDTILPQWLGAALPQGVIVTDTSLSVRYWSPWLAEQTSMAAEQVIGSPLAELFPEIVGRDLQRYFTRALAGETTVLRQREHGYVLSLPAPPNTAKLAHMQQRAVISPLSVEGQIVGTLTIITDLTERAAQDALLQQMIAQQDETLALLDTLITKAPIGFAFIDTELRYRGINERLAEFNGLSVAEHMGRTLWEVIPDLADQQIPLFLEVIETGMPRTNIEIRGQTRARPGEGRVWQVSYYPVRTSDHRRLGVGVLVTEITERSRREQRDQFMAGLSAALTASLDYQTTLDALARAVVPFMADWCVIDIAGGEGEGRRAAVAHADPAQEQLARELQRRFPPPLGPDGPLGPSIHQGRSLRVPTLDEEQLRAAMPDPAALELVRSLRPSSALLVPLVASGTTLGVLSLIRCGGGPAYSPDDLALAEEVAARATVALENARLFAAAERSRALAEDAVRARDAFFSIAAHELRTPLTTLLGRSQLLQKWLAQDEGCDQRNLRSIQIIVEQAQRLNRMITSLLEVSRIQAGRFSIEPAPMDLAALVRRVVEETRLTLSLHSILLREDGGPLIVSGDEVRLEQAIQNLLGNAVKYSPGGGEVRIEVAGCDGEARVTVSDMGIGIPASARSQLFKRFYRAGNAERLGISGLGIGLFVVNEIVELHRGRISVESTEGKGSSFTMCVPLAT